MNTRLMLFERDKYALKKLKKVIHIMQQFKRYRMFIVEIQGYAVTLITSLFQCDTLIEYNNQVSQSNLGKAWEKRLNLYQKRDRSSHRRCSIKKACLKFFQDSQENTCTRIIFLINLEASPYNFIKRETLSLCAFL